MISWGKICIARISLTVVSHLSIVQIILKLPQYLMSYELFCSILTSIEYIEVNQIMQPSRILKTFHHVVTVSNIWLIVACKLYLVGMWKLQSVHKLQFLWKEEGLNILYYSNKYPWISTSGLPMIDKRTTTETHNFWFDYKRSDIERGRISQWNIE